MIFLIDERWKENKEMTIEQLLDAMKKRSGMFIIEERIDYIYYLISGYCGAKSYLEEDDIDRKFRCWFGKWLLQWIEENINSKYKPMSSYWYLDIKAIAGGEEKEVPLFYELCEKFFDDYRNRRGYFEDFPLVKAE